MVEKKEAVSSPVSKLLSCLRFIDWADYSDSEEYEEEVLHADPAVASAQPEMKAEAAVEIPAEPAAEESVESAYRGHSRPRGGRYGRRGRGSRGPRYEYKVVDAATSIGIYCVSLISRANKGWKRTV